MKLSLNLRCLPDQPEEDAFWSYFASQLGRIDLMRLGIHVPETLHPVKETQCLKITEKVSFNIASEASYVYILSKQKLIKNTKKWSILTSFQTVLPGRSLLIRQKLVENAKIQKRHFSYIL